MQQRIAAKHCEFTSSSLLRRGRGRHGDPERVEPFGSAETNYRLTLVAQPEGPPDGAGNSLGAARD